MAKAASDGAAELAWRCYALASYLLSPLLLVALVWRLVRRPAYRARWYERFGLCPRLSGRVLWIHAVSVGEAQAAVPLVQALAAAHPDYTVLVTTTTPTGAAHVQRLLGNAVVHAFMPYDLPDCVGRFLRRSRAAALVIIETELWPGLMHACAHRGIPVVLASARLSPRSARGYQRLAPLFRPRPGHEVVVAAQSQADAERWQSLFGERAQVVTTGNMKWDFDIDASTVAAGEAWRQAHVPAGAPVLLAGSTHEGEEQALLDAWQALQRGAVPDCRLVLVPRHPERFEAVAQLVRRRGLALHRRSARGSDPDARVFLIDTMGELKMLYAAADVAFVGGTLVPVGGHNPLEPALLAKPVLLGPHTFTAQPMVDLLLEAQAALQVGDGAALATAAAALLGDGARAGAMGKAGQQAVLANRGAVTATARLVSPLLLPGRLSESAPPAPSGSG